jgi:hypothetical protein
MWGTAKPTQAAMVVGFSKANIPRKGDARSVTLRSNCRSSRAKIQDTMATQIVSCPFCELVLAIETSTNETLVTYDHREWIPVCKYPDLGSPVLCLAKGDGNPWHDGKIPGGKG